MRSVLLLTSILALSACDLAPDLTLPEITLPGAFKNDKAEESSSLEPASDGKWRRVDDTARIVEFAWWRMFDNDALDALMETAMKDNPSLEVAIERVKAARAAAGNRDADLYPSIEVGAGPERSRSGEATIKANAPNASPNIKAHTFYRVNGTITYEVDLFGRNRNLAKEAWFQAGAEEENYLAARLSLQAEIAETYFRLASLTAEEKLLARTIETREEALKLMRAKHELGAIDTLALASSETDLATVKGQAASITDARRKAEHARAVLIGKPPSEATFDVVTLDTSPPTIPAGLPSSLLERRPDIKRAVEGIKAANARIGVTRTGYFPEISLSAMGGFVSGDLKDLFKWSSRTWAIGPVAGTMLSQPIFEGGRIAAARAQSDAQYKGAVATYRGAVLQAFREVEDGLSTTQAAADRMKNAQDALAAATRAYDVAHARYDAGYSSHLEFLDAERGKLAAERANVQIRGEHYIATIELIKALGGSWDAPRVPEKTGETAPVEPVARPTPAPEPAPEPAAKPEEPAPTEEVAKPEEPAAKEEVAPIEEPKPETPAETEDKPKEPFELQWMPTL